MNIFLVLHPAGNLSVPGSITWYKNLYEPLIDLGHKVYFYRLDEKEKKWGLKLRTQKFKQSLSEDLLKTVNIEHSKNNFDLFFSYLNDLDIETGVIDEIKKIGILTLNFSCNNTHQFHLIKNISPHFDYNLHSEKSAGTKFEKIDANHIWFQMAANPKYYYPIELQRDIDVSFIGMNYAKRAHYVEHLLKNEIDLECYGPGWLPPPFPRMIRKRLKNILFYLKILFRQGESDKLSAYLKDYKYKKEFAAKFKKYLHPPVEENDLVNLFNRSKINLGFLEVFSVDNDSSKAVAKHLHLREFEVPMSGGLYITNFSEELAEHFEPGKEVLTFSDEEELLGKVKYYLTHPVEAERIRQAGHNRALQSHTYQKRLKDLFSTLNLI